MLTSAASSECWRLNCKMFAKWFQRFFCLPKSFKKHSFPLFQHSIGGQPGCVSHIWRHPITDNTHRCLTQQTNVSGCPVSSASLTRRKSNAIVNQPQPRFTWTTDFEMIILTHEPETPIQSDTMQSIVASRSTNMHLLFVLSGGVNVDSQFQRPQDRLILRPGQLGEPFEWRWIAHI